MHTMEVRRWEELSSPYLEGEGVGILPKLLHQLVLQRSEGLGCLVRHRREDLGGQDIEVLPEGQPDNVEVISAVAKRASQRHIHWSQMGTERSGVRGRVREREGTGLRKEKEKNTLITL